jgi:hypothetical protein
MEVTLTEVLTVYGPLGILSLLTTVAAIKLYRDKNAAEERHRDEMTTMVAREIERSTTIVDRYHAFAEKLHDVADRLERRMDRREP